MLELYRAIEPYLAALGLTALSAGVIGAALFGAIKWFGESWITSKFSERLETFKHAQQREIEHLKFQINASMDRAVKLHQREFETVPQAWSTLVEAFNAVKSFTSPFQSYADLHRVSDADLDEFLDDTELSNAQKNEIRTSSDRNETYQSILFWHRLNKVQNVFREHHLFLLKNSIFMTAAMKIQFTEIGTLAWNALMEHKMNHEMKIWAKRPQLEKFENQGDTMLSALEAEIQKRLWSNASLS
jgi:hypothetical protein